MDLSGKSYYLYVVPVIGDVPGTDSAARWQVSPVALLIP
jgi:hypothetical protein